MGKDKTEMDYSKNYRIYDRDRSEQDGQEIDLKDLLFYILYRWRSLLLIAALAGILAGGYADRYNRGLPEKKDADAEGIGRTAASGERREGKTAVCEL